MVRPVSSKRKLFSASKEQKENEPGKHLSFHFDYFLHKLCNCYCYCYFLIAMIIVIVITIIPIILVIIHCLIPNFQTADGKLRAKQGEALGYPESFSVNSIGGQRKGGVAANNHHHNNSSLGIGGCSGIVGGAGKVVEGGWGAEDVAPSTHHTPNRPVMPMSERQQIALLMQMSSPSPPGMGMHLWCTLAFTQLTYCCRENVAFTVVLFYKMSLHINGSTSVKPCDLT